MHTRGWCLPPRSLGSCPCGHPALFLSQVVPFPPSTSCSVGDLSEVTICAAPPVSASVPCHLHGAGTASWTKQTPAPLLAFGPEHPHTKHGDRPCGCRGGNETPHSSTTGAGLSWPCHTASQYRPSASSRAPQRAQRVLGWGRTPYCLLEDFSGISLQEMGSGRNTLCHGPGHEGELWGEGRGQPQPPGAVPVPGRPARPRCSTQTRRGQRRLNFSSFAAQNRKSQNIKLSLG